MRIIANSETYDLPEGTSLDTFIRDRSLAPERVVVERNGDALTPGEARQAVLTDGDRLEIVRIVAGG